MGDPDGSHPWTAIADAWWIGSPDSSTTTVIYLFSKPFPCGTGGLTGPGSGWDAKVPKDTEVIELKLSWAGANQPTAAATYPVAAPPGGVGQAAPPARGNGFATWASLKGTPPVPETPATSGMVGLGAYNASSDVPGTFKLTFPGVLSGGFDAKYCAGGGEP
jgi:hypothetical protein